MRKTKIVTALAAAGLFAATLAGAQEAPAPQMLMIVQEQVKPPMTAQYEEATQELIAALAAAEVEGIRFTAASGPDLGYIYGIPVDGFAGTGEVIAAWEAAIGKAGEKAAAAMARSEQAVDHQSVYHVLRRLDLSYWPEEPAVPAGEVSFAHYGFYYVIPGKSQELEAVSKRWAELFEKKEIPHGYGVYQKITGADLPVYVVVQVGRSEADFYAAAAESNQALGDEGKELQAKTMALLRRYESTSAWLRPDLAYPPPAPAKPAAPTE